jgi:hypothetical protein
MLQFTLNGQPSQACFDGNLPCTAGAEVDLVMAFSDIAELSPVSPVFGKKVDPSAFLSVKWIGFDPKLEFPS